MSTLFFDAVGALFSLNLVWFIDITMNNLLWVVLGYAFVTAFVSEKHTVFYFFLFWPYVWLFLDFISATGVGLYLFGIGLYLPLKMIAMSAADSSSFVKKNFAGIWAITVFTLLLVMTFLV